MCGMYIIHGMHRPKPRSSGGNTSSNPQVSARIPRPAFNGMERICQRHGCNQNSHAPVLVRKPLCNQFRVMKLLMFLEVHSFVSMDQSAYLKRHSTQTWFHCVIDDWLENVNDCVITGACLPDISKCFDSIIQYDWRNKKCMVSLALS